MYSFLDEKILNIKMYFCNILDILQILQIKQFQNFILSKEFIIEQS